MILDDEMRNTSKDSISQGNKRKGKSSTVMGVLINVGSSSSNPNGRGRVFNDSSFEYLPIPERLETKEKVPTYRELGFMHLKSPELPVHLDPEFVTFTYGHVRRGFGDMKNLLKLRKSDTLYFYATLQRDDDWYPYVIGYFRAPVVYDCRKLRKKEIKNYERQFVNNAHLKRTDPSVDLLISGGRGSRLLEKAFPLAEDNDHSTLRKSLRNIILTSTGKKIKSGTPWYRWTLVCHESNRLLRMLEVHESSS